MAEYLGLTAVGWQSMLKSWWDWVSSTRIVFVIIETWLTSGATGSYDSTAVVCCFGFTLSFVLSDQDNTEKLEGLSYL
jgi:hypothetical protein